MVRFYTSNIYKYLQAKLLFEAYGLPLLYFKRSTAEYDEDYSLGTRELLRRAIEQVRHIVGRASLFFVEDTSLRIEALSSKDEDFPGLAVKDWFARVTFAEVNRQLPRSLRLRGATIKSDIALHVPGLQEPVYFHGETVGTISHSPPRFRKNPLYPWLTPKTFNGWFVPNGAERRLGEMSIEEAMEFDFRARALSALIERLEEYSAMLNAPQDCYSIHERIVDPQQQPFLFPPTGEAFIVVGRTCAGKTTFGNVASLQGRTVIEASSVVRSLRQPKDQHLSPFQFADQLLSTKGRDIVARRIVDLYNLGPDSSFIITGFRTIEELEVLRAHCPQVRVVLIDAAQRTRFARFLHRGRDRARKTPPSIEEFRRLDREQESFGLLRVAEDFADIRVTNEGTLERFGVQVSKVLANPSRPQARGVSTDLHPPGGLKVHRLYRCLVVLAQSGRSMTNAEIADAAGGTIDPDAPRYAGRTMTPNNVNKILKNAVELAVRSETITGETAYQISDIGRAFIRLLEELSRKPRTQV